MLGYNRSSSSHLGRLTPVPIEDRLQGLFADRNAGGHFYPRPCSDHYHPQHDRLAQRHAVQGRGQRTAQRPRIFKNPGCQGKCDRYRRFRSDGRPVPYDLPGPRHNQTILLKSQTLPAGVRIASENPAHTWTASATRPASVHAEPPKVVHDRSGQSTGQDQID